MALLLLLLVVLSGCTSGAGHVEVATMEKIQYPPRDAESMAKPVMDSACREWELSEEDIERIIVLADSVGRQDYGYLVCHPPCNYVGDVLLDGVTYQFQVNATAGVILFRDGKEAYFKACTDPGCRKYFINEVDGIELVPPCDG